MSFKVFSHFISGLKFNSCIYRQYNKNKILVLESFSNPQTLLDRIDNIDKGNIVLEKNANDENCLFVNNDDSFSLLIGVINTAMYHKDGVHLNWHGTLRLADNLGIQPKLHNNHSDKDITRGQYVARRQPYNRHNGHGLPEGQSGARRQPGNRHNKHGQPGGQSGTRRQSDNRHNRHGQHIQKLSSTHANKLLYCRSFHNRRSLDQKSEGNNKHRRQHVPSRNHQRGYNRQTWGKGETLCWFCGESNHTTSVCRHGTYITCNTCNMTGHKSKMCTYH